MKRITRSISICLLSILLFSSACEKTEPETIHVQEVFRFVPQQVQPIEENPSALPAEILSEYGLHIVDIQRPNMDEIDHSDDVIHALLGSANQVVNISGKDLVDFVYMETGDSPVHKSVSAEDGYLRAFIQRESVGEDGSEQENYGGLWGSIYLDAINQFIAEAGGNQECPNCAILIKFRENRVNAGLSIGFSNSNVFVNQFIDDNGGLNVWSGDEHNEKEYSIGNTRREYVNSLQLIDNEWFYALVAMDEHSGYRFITWQENDPSNHAFYACDLSSVFKRNDDLEDSIMWADISFDTVADEASLDIDSIVVYAFENLNDTEAVHQTEALVHTYTNDQEKYELAVQLFEAEDYYNAYTLFTELDGQVSGDYLAECERLLTTIEINNPRAAGKIRKALKEHGMSVYEYLYVFQAEKLENLDLSECLIDDVSFIRNFPNLKVLNLEKNAISDLTALKDMHALESLSLGKNHISDILPLSNLASLEYLDLNNNRLEDISGLNNLPSLVEVDLSSNDLTAIADLDNLKNLEALDLSYNLISSLSAFENSPIKELNIMNTDINDLQAAARFTELESLYAGFPYVWKGNPLYLLTGKYELDHHFFDGLSGLEALSGHQNLRKLYLSRLNTESLAPLTTMPKLESLIFHRYLGNDDHESLASLVNLKELTLDSGFAHTYFLANLTKLEKLSIETFCYVEDTSVISGLANLEELRMYKYGEDLNFLTGLKNLRLLELKNWDTIEDYSALLTLDQLEYLYLEGMAVYDLSVISQIEGLKFLKLDNAQINNINDIGQLKNLECFLLRNPQVVGESQPESFDRSLYDGMDHLKLALMHAGAQEGWAYDLGDSEFLETIEEPSEKGVEEKDYDYYWIENMEDAKNFADYVGSQNQVISGMYFSEGESIKLTIPNYARSLFIFSDSEEPVKLELDCGENHGLERLVVGHIDVEENSEGFGQGNFILDTLDGLAGCANLKELYLNNIEINDLSALAGFDKLELLELNGEFISDTAALVSR